MNLCFSSIAVLTHHDKALCTIDRSPFPGLDSHRRLYCKVCRNYNNSTKARPGLTPRLLQVSREGDRPGIILLHDGPLEHVRPVQKLQVAGGHSGAALQSPG